MKEKIGNIWDFPCDVVCITTNDVIKKNNELTMGKGIAWEAKKCDTNVSYYFANHIKKCGNTPCLFLRDIKPHFCSLPTKYHWRDKSDIELIENSIKLLVSLINQDKNLKEISMPRPGCGNGGLDWKDVKSVIEPYLDDRFTVWSTK